MGASPYGGGVWTGLFDQLLPPTGMKVIAVESFERSATSTTPQALKLIAAKPDAIFVAAGGTPAVVPIRDLRQRGFKGIILAGHGIGLPDFILCLCQLLLNDLGPAQQAFAAVIELALIVMDCINDQRIVLKVGNLRREVNLVRHIALRHQSRLLGARNRFIEQHVFVLINGFLDQLSRFIGFRGNGHRAKQEARRGRNDRCGR